MGLLKSMSTSKINVESLKGTANNLMKKATGSVKSASKLLAFKPGSFCQCLSLPRKILSYMWAQNIWLPTSHYEKVFTIQYLPYRVKFNWWFVVPTTVFLYWLIVLKRKYFVNESKALNKRKYYTLEPSYYNFFKRRSFAKNLRKEHERSTFIV
eukprot:TRINITY_DN7115_c0_g2_i1.p2 TRINITY_DN7115_c0_g2~~TRINITY_DN7115_c0_g2_i1.p2  ORF type:complete len:154 (-),score=44.11 TRINITY_DN7115_c0_g2_i1:141-602(-)